SDQRTPVIPTTTTGPGTKPDTVLEPVPEPRPAGELASAKGEPTSVVTSTAVSTAPPAARRSAVHRIRPAYGPRSAAARAGRSAAHTPHGSPPKPSGTFTRLEGRRPMAGVVAPAGL